MKLTVLFSYYLVNYWSSLASGNFKKICRNMPIYFWYQYFTLFHFLGLSQGRSNINSIIIRVITILASYFLVISFCLMHILGIQHRSKLVLRSWSIYNSYLWSIINPLTPKLV